MKTTFKLKKTKFFVKPTITAFRDKGGEVLTRFGAYVMRRARTSIRKRKRASRPGQQPTNVTGILRGITGREPGIFFFYDQWRQTVTVGPTKANQVFFNHHREPVQGTIPSVLEYGGQIRVLEANYGSRGKDKWYRADLRSKRRLAEMETRLRTVTIAARPYMQPAFEKELPKLRQWKKAA